MWVRQCLDGDSAAVLVPKASHPGLRGPGCKWPLEGLREANHVHMGLPAAHPGGPGPKLCRAPCVGSEPLSSPSKGGLFKKPGQSVFMLPVPLLSIFQAEGHATLPFAPSTPWTMLFANTLGFGAHGGPPILTPRSFLWGSQGSGHTPPQSRKPSQRQPEPSPRHHAALGPSWSQAAEPSLSGPHWDPRLHGRKEGQLRADAHSDSGLPSKDDLEPSAASGLPCPRAPGASGQRPSVLRCFFARPSAGPTET